MPRTGLLDLHESVEAKNYFFENETFSKVYPGIERIPSLKKRVGIESGASFLFICVLETRE